MKTLIHLHRWLPRFIVVAALVATSAAAQEKILLDGSTGMIPLATALATAYQQQFAEPRIEIGQGLGTGQRLRALADGRIQIALASHGLRPEDLQKDQLKLVEVARGAIVFAVNASVPVDGFTEAQICDLFSGRTRNWRELGGLDQSVQVLTRPPAEVDPEVIRAKVACFRDLKEVDTAKVMARGGDMAKALAETPHAVGMTSMTVVEQSGGRIRALMLGDAAATPQNVKAGRYALTRDYFFVIKEPPSAAVTRFVEFVLGPAGDAAIRASGAIPTR
jgi:phosphate transport system substrate-binding protein